MKKILYSLLFFVLIVDNLLAQQPEKRTQWQEQPLTWLDFSGKPDLQNEYDANTNSGISYSWSLRNSKDGVDFLYEVDVFFYPDLSWVKQGRKTESLLAHEQLHFDISELHGRKLRKLMAEYVPDLDSDIKEVLEGIYRANEKSRRQMQEEYDHETNHGQNVRAQSKWEIFIKTELAKLEQFSS